MESLLRAALALALAGCSLVYDPGRWMGGDASRGDAGRGPDGGAPDGGIDAGRVVRVRVVNAVGDTPLGAQLDSLSITLDGSALALDHGCVATRMDVPVGETELTIGDGAATVMRTLSLTEDTLVVIARDADGNLAAFARGDVPPSPSKVGRFAIEYLNVVRQSATLSPLYIVTDVHDTIGSAAPLPFGEWSRPHEYGMPASVALGYTDGAFGLTPRIMTTFTPGILTESTFVILSGSADVHPAVPRGPRAIAVPAGPSGCGDVVLPDPQVVLANLSREGQSSIFGGGPDAFACAIDTSFGAVAVVTNGVSIVVPVYGNLTRIGLAGTAEAACTPGMAHIVDLDGMVEPGRRYLLAVTGPISADATAWTVSLIEEQPPETSAMMALTFAHLAPMNAPAAVDIVGAGTRYVTGLEVGARQGTVIDSSAFVASPWDVSQTVSGVVVGRYEAAGAVTSMPGGQFVVLIDQFVPSGPLEARVAFIRATYGGRAWEIGVDSP